MEQITWASFVWVTWANLLLYAVMYAWFIWAYRAHFRRVGGEAKQTIPLKYGGLLTMAAVLFSLLRWGSYDAIWGATAFCLGATAFLLFLWALRTNRAKPLSLVYSPDLPEHLVDRGPYALVRHPFYTAYLLSYFGGALASRQGWLFLFPVGMTVIYWRAAAAEEAKFRASALSQDYEAYRTRVGMFLPKLFRAGR